MRLGPSSLESRISKLEAATALNGVDWIDALPLRAVEEIAEARPEEVLRVVKKWRRWLNKEERKDE